MVLTIKNFESQQVGPGVIETAPTNLVGVAGTLKATLTWTSATGESGVTWTEEKLVRKEGSAPSGSMDGTVVTTITTKDTYASTGYEDTGLDNTKTYYYKAFAIYDNGTEKGSSAVNVTPQALTYNWNFVQSEWTALKGTPTFSGGQVSGGGICMYKEIDTIKNIKYIKLEMVGSGVKATWSRNLDMWFNSSEPYLMPDNNPNLGQIIGIRVPYQTATGYNLGGLYTTDANIELRATSITNNTDYTITGIFDIENSIATLSLNGTVIGTTAITQDTKDYVLSGINYITFQTPGNGGIIKSASITTVRS